MPAKIIDQPQLYAWLKAASELGEPMPTNEQIQGRFACKSGSAPVFALQQLQKKGLIQIEVVSRYARRITIVETGAVLQSRILGHYRGRAQVARAVEASKAPKAAPPPEDEAAEPEPVRRSDRMRSSFNPFMRIPPSSTCCWIDEPSLPQIMLRARAGDLTLYCGERSVAGQSWCEEHLKRISATRRGPRNARILNGRAMSEAEVTFYRKLRTEGFSDEQARDRVQTTRNGRKVGSAR